MSLLKYNIHVIPYNMYSIVIVTVKTPVTQFLSILY